ncbi:MAG: flavodoxin family protein [Anaerolineae bacterium]|jgi:multimeric flavodoxin WrbA|nr:flavodoxin family protein [Anaerolineae bacterium]
MKKSAVILVGSRNHDGQTAQAVQAVFQALFNHGVIPDRIFLPDISIERCRQCDDNGWGDCRRIGSCVINDDFEEIVEKLRDTDLAVFATPVYYGDLSESMRAFTDRLRRICTHADGKQGISGKPAIGICVAGGGGGGAPECCVSLKKVLNTCGFDMLDMIPVRRQNLAMKLTVLEEVGEWLAKSH